MCSVKSCCITDNICDHVYCIICTNLIYVTSEHKKETFMNNINNLLLSTGSISFSSLPCFKKSAFCFHQFCDPTDVVAIFLLSLSISGRLRFVHRLPLASRGSRACRCPHLRKHSRSVFLHAEKITRDLPHKLSEFSFGPVTSWRSRNLGTRLWKVNNRVCHGNSDVIIVHLTSGLRWRACSL